MVTKRNSTDEKEVKKGRVGVGKLKLNKETVQNLSAKKAKQIKGGLEKNPRSVPVVCVPKTLLCGPL